MKIDVISRIREVFDWEVSPRDISSHLLKHSLFAVIVISVASAYGNYYLDLGNELSIILLFSAFIYFLGYYLIRWRNKFTIPFLIFFLLSLILINFLWFFNGGTKGGTLLIIHIFFTLLLFVSRDKFSIYIVVFYTINISVLFYIEYTYPYLIDGYASDKQRLIDIIIVSYLFYLGGLPLLILGKKQFRKAKERAEESERMKTAFIANMSHEIRTPMHAIMGFSEFLQDDMFSDEEKKQFIQTIRDNGDLLLHLINNILNLSKLDAGSIKVELAPFDLRELLLQVYNSYQPLITNPKVKLILKDELPDILPPIVSDHHLLYQVFSNLLNNALKVTDEGEIIIGAKVDKNISFFVSDTGPGIPEEHHQLIFDRFTQVGKPNAQKRSGVGLGLSICQSIMELLGGSINVYSDGISGTTFTFKLPFSQLSK